MKIMMNMFKYYNNKIKINKINYLKYINQFHNLLYHNNKKIKLIL
jgi:hypothetical protein